MQSDWKRAFRLITCVSEFLQIWRLHKTTENHDAFILEYIQQKVIVWKTLRNPYVWLILGHFCTFQENCKFSKKSGSVNFEF